MNIWTNLTVCGGSMTRHQMREAVFILLFERSFSGDTAENIIVLAREIDEFDIDEVVAETFIKIVENEAIIDQTINKYLKNWSIARISKVSLAILRLAVYEVLFWDNIDNDISISEAIKLAYMYTYKDDVSFINGVLSSLDKQGDTPDLIETDSSKKVKIMDQELS